MKRYLILALSLLLLLKIVTSKIIDLRFKKICPLVQTSTQISSKEAEVFFAHWVEYINRGYMAKVPEGFAFDDQNISERIPWIVKLWFDKNCINPERFYYTEQRMRTILKAYEMRKHNQRVIDVLRSQMNDDMDDKQKLWYQNLIEEQEQMSKIEGVTDEELSIIEGREAQIRDVLR